MKQTLKLWIIVGILTICGTMSFASCTANDDRSALPLGSSKNPSEKKPTIERIVERGKLLVATTGDYRPLSYQEALVWTSASFTETTSAPGIVNAAAYDIPVLIQSNGGTLTVQGAVDDGTPVSVYSVNGTQAGSTVIQDGQAQVATSLQPGSIAIVKIGQKSVKIVVK